jgi:hypothetical protein
MEDKQKALKDRLIVAEMHLDKENNKLAYLTLRRAVLEYLGISQTELNDKVLELEA